jgi:hypothetical protein
MTAYAFPRWDAVGEEMTPLFGVCHLIGNQACTYLIIEYGQCCEALGKYVPVTTAEIKQ